ncbi:Putative Zn-dependent protease [Enhydrobacter aerosaccus]|uniref:Putative Zn-dependent protease n=1 Tax=Enhydrobacter aerosaccus TaxID=225324 RepID=A0A1T4QHM0_9HYPH|nr:M48 family metalloprotease [Enhydrobacter aerosaccus]SKA03283.1 Putative Zn-dependent protease [Enhydrobacter aerosaccus]
MGFRSILALIALLFVATACTSGNNLPQPGASEALPPQIEREVGPVYTSRDLQSLVDRVGRRVVADSRLPGSFRFYVLDDPIPNAHAISSGYVFVTRGLLALIEDEAELAAAFGHELGHIELKHAAQRERVRRDVTDAAVKAAIASGSVSVGRSVARDGLLALRRYSRDQELEADRVGLGYLVHAGYRGDAMATLIEKLQLQARLEDEIMGPSSDTADRSALSTHPNPEQRLAALQTLPAARQRGDSGREPYLTAVEGMSVDDSPEEGFVRGSSFLHPVMRLAFTAPSDFRLFNAHDGVLGVGRGRSLMFFSCTDEEVPGRLDVWMRNELKPTPVNIQATEIGGAEAAIGSRPRGSDTSLAQIRYVLIRRGQGICYFNLLSDGPDRDRQIEAMVAATRSFHTLSEAEAAALQPLRLHVVPSAGTSPEALAARMPYRDYKMDRLLTLNGVDQPAALMRLPQVKIVQP